jgi:hypothetical protein
MSLRLTLQHVYANVDAVVLESGLENDWNMLIAHHAAVEATAARSRKGDLNDRARSCEAILPKPSMIRWKGMAEMLLARSAASSNVKLSTR